MKLDGKFPLIYILFSHCIGVLTSSVFLTHEQSFAKTNEPVYEDPFDLGGGGAVLTRATQEGMLINNPAQLPYGGKFFRWLGFKTAIGAAQDSIDFVQNLGSGQDAANSSGADDAQGFVDQLFKAPINFSVSQALSFITNNGGFAVFGSTHPDIRAWENGDPEGGTGVPNVVIRNETYGGAYGSVASRAGVDWLSVGLSAKYLYISDNQVRVDLISQAAVQNAQDQVSAIQSSGVNNGIGVDAGGLLFLQGQYVDFRLAAVLQDVGSTKLTGSSGRNVIEQTMNVGLGLTFHNQADAIHLSADLRDIGGVYEEENYKKIYLGTKVLIRTYLGLTTGLYHGFPTYGVEFDFILFRLAAATYAKEYTRTPGIDRRKISLISISMGFDF